MPVSLTGTPHPMSVITRPRGRDLMVAELRSFASELAERPDLWIDCVTHDPTQRRYEELLCDEHITAWLICWMADHDTGFHDHDASAGAVAVVGGSSRCKASARHRRRPGARSTARRTVDGPGAR